MPPALFSMSIISQEKLTKNISNHIQCTVMYFNLVLFYSWSNLSFFRRRSLVLKYLEVFNKLLTYYNIAAV